MGKPVVATSIFELKRFSPFVQIGDTAEIWKRKIIALVNRPWPKTYKTRQRKLAEENSWAHKIEAITSHISRSISPNT